MRLNRLSITGFRGFSSSMELDLDADAVILVGANGSGKTSFFDAILWALSGSVPRLGEDQAAVLSRYSSTGEARVELVLSTEARQQFTIIRRFDGSMNLSVESEGEPVLRGPSAEAQLLDVLWPDAKLASEPWDALSRALTRGVYLQQDLVREFIDADDEQDRFAVIGEIVGAGRVGELQRQLERAKAGWTRSTNVLITEIEPLRARRTEVEQRLSRLADVPQDVVELEEAWRSWWSRATSHSLQVAAIPLEAPDAARRLDSALNELQSRALHDERRLSGVEQLLLHLDQSQLDEQETEPLRAAVTSAESALAAARVRLEKAQAEAATERRRQVELTERTEELRTLAQLALRHLEERCPICEQDYDIEKTRQRLERLVAGADEVAPSTRAVEVEPLAGEVESAERVLMEATGRLQYAERANAARANWRRTLERLMGALDLEDSDDLRSRAEALARSVRETMDSLQILQRDGENLGLRLARSSEFAQRAELERELEALDRELARRDSEISARNATGELAAEILSALREASSDIVTSELDRIEPLLQRIYATVDPHPAFRTVRFLTRTVRGRGRVWTSIDDRTANVSVQEPETVLSSSQLNVLAVSVFLALNLGVETLPLDVVALDDPLQSLDEVNLLGLIDLLRRVKGKRQIVVSTHDLRFGSLLGRKLRPISSNQRTRVIHFEGWTREGPLVSREEIPSDPKPLRLVA